MFTRGLASIIKSLTDKKYRQQTGLFLVEGEKSVAETLTSNFTIETLLINKHFYTRYSKIIKNKNIKYELVEPGEIEKVSALESNSTALAIVKQDTSTKLEANTLDFKIKDDEIILALDNIRDPGNLGTIIRIADWYGIKKIITSTSTVDLYNPKVISSTKGSFTRVKVYYINLKNYLNRTKIPVLGAFLTGQNIHKFNFPKNGILVVGNESNGITDEIEKLITQKVTIPSFGEAESLNAAIATAIILDNWKRN